MERYWKLLKIKTKIYDLLANKCENKSDNFLEKY